MFQRWAVDLTAYTYEIQHKAGHKIPHADYLSRYTEFGKAKSNDCLLLQPLPVSRQQLRDETKKIYGQLFAALQRGWTVVI